MIITVNNEDLVQAFSAWSCINNSIIETSTLEASGRFSEARTVHTCGTATPSSAHACAHPACCALRRAVDAPGLSTQQPGVAAAADCGDV